MSDDWIKVVHVLLCKCEGSKTDFMSYKGVSLLSVAGAGKMYGKFD